MHALNKRDEVVLLDSAPGNSKEQNTPDLDKKKKGGKGINHQKCIKPNVEKSLSNIAVRDKSSGLGFEQLMLRKTNEILITMQMIVKHLEDLSINSNTKQTDNFFESDKCPELPLSTKEQFDAFMEKLMSNSFLKQVAAASGKIGGRDLSNIVTNICVKFVSNSLAMNYSWTGRKKPKLALQNTNFAKLMMAAVRINKPQAKDNEISELVSKWFAGAKKRVDRGDNKENNKNEEDLNNSISDDETQDPLENDADDEN